MASSLLESFRTVRWVRTLNLVLQAVLVVTFFVGLNIVARNHAWRFDLTQARKFTLTPETISFIRNLKSPVHIVMTTSSNNVNPDVRGLIDEYVYATANPGGSKITQETLDIYKDRHRAEELGIETANVLVLRSGGRQRVVTMDELYTFKEQKHDTFKGEDTLTAAILEVAEPVRLKIYFLSGHQELSIDDPDTHFGLSSIRDQLKLRNFQVETVDLNISRRVPADAALLICAWPRAKFSAAELEMVREHLATNYGRMIFLLPPGLPVQNLNLEPLLLDDWGILVNTDLIIDPENIAENGDLFLRWITPDHPITKPLVGLKAVPRVGLARSVFPDPGRSLTNLNTQTLIATSAKAWGERNNPLQPVRERGIDTLPLPGMQPSDRLGVVVASERLAVRDNLPFSVRGGKVVVFGTGDFVSNSRIDDANLAVFLNAVNWAVDRDHQLTIPPRRIDKFQLSLNANEFMKLRYAVLLGLPGGALMLGLLVYWTRRR